jgi:hypothetical protein
MAESSKPKVTKATFSGTPNTSAVRNLAAESKERKASRPHPTSFSTKESVPPADVLR